MPIRLLNTGSLGFEVFHTDDFSKVPKYAILSHVWGDDDEHATYAKFVSAVHDGMVTTGTLNRCFQKIIRFCRQTATDGYEYAWVDTCCIDKDNESELCEAINSMFRWYKESALCYAYLSDVPTGDVADRLDSAFQNSRWFTRGWTLQELIAPRSIVFYSRDWKPLNTKSTLKNVISDVTGIDEHVLDTGDVSDVSVSVKLSWAAKRKTTVAEDQAYCLLGIFDIFMPLVYGERENAFRRLLEEIAGRYSDQTLFSWTGDGRPSGMLASSPAQYLPSQNAFSVIPSLRNFGFSLTNRGVQLHALLFPLPLCNLYAAVLPCLPGTSSHSTDGFFVHFLYRIYHDDIDFVRVLNDEVAYFPVSLQKTRPSLLENTNIYINQPRSMVSMNNKVVFCLKDYPSDSSHPGLCVLGPSNSVGKFSSMRQSPGQPHLITMQLDDQMPSAVLLFRNDAGQQIAACLTLWGQEIKVGLSTEFVDDDMSRIADAFLFGQSSMVVKQPGSFSVQASPRRGKKVSLILDEPTDHASMGTACNVSLNAANGFWLHAVGPGVWPGCWTRYFDSLATATPVKERTGLFRSKTLERWAQVMT